MQLLTPTQLREVVGGPIIHNGGSVVAVPTPSNNG